VCLGVRDRDPEARREAEQIMRRFCERCGWQPDPMRAVAGALPYTRYNWLKRWIMKRTVAKAGGDTDTSRDYEYTDWDDLRAVTRDFARLVRTGGRGVTQVPFPGQNECRHEPVWTR
jgi:menaquinone-dependent protoporphyrinogen oxidase